MRQLLKTALSLLLILSGLGALYGGWNLFTYPDGHTLHISTELLRHSPFADFLLPGMILFIVIGLHGLFACVLLIKGIPYASRIVLVQGLLLTGWIVVETLLIRRFQPLQLALGLAGVICVLLASLYPRYR